MYFGGHRSGNVSGGGARHKQDEDVDDDEEHQHNNNGEAENWAFVEPPQHQRQQHPNGGSASPLQQAFMQSLLDLEGFCVDSKRKQRRRRNINAENNCICLLHQILIKVVMWAVNTPGEISCTFLIRVLLFSLPTNERTFF